MIKTIVKCDRCNPSGATAAMMCGRGVHEGGWYSAESVGWKRVKGQHVCPECFYEAEYKQGAEARVAENVGMTETSSPPP